MKTQELANDIKEQAQSTEAGSFYQSLVALAAQHEVTTPALHSALIRFQLMHLMLEFKGDETQLIEMLDRLYDLQAAFADQIISLGEIGELWPDLRG
jgi:hypothetical protein